MFIKSDYWGVWSRILNKGFHIPTNNLFVEVNLTPLQSWDVDVRPIRIRAHSTNSNKNKPVTELPEDIKNLMVKNLGEELVNRLLFEDFLPMINWDLYREFCNGGANLEEIKQK
jgi:hypothetical protein